MEDGGRIDPEILQTRTDAAGRVEAPQQSQSEVKGSAGIKHKARGTSERDCVQDLSSHEARPR